MFESIVHEYLFKIVSNFMSYSAVYYTVYIGNSNQYFFV